MAAACGRSGFWRPLAATRCHLARLGGITSTLDFWQRPDRAARVQVVQPVETNIVLLIFCPGSQMRRRWCRRWRPRGVLVSTFGPRRPGW